MQIKQRQRLQCDKSSSNKAERERERERAYIVQRFSQKERERALNPNLK